VPSEIFEKDFRKLSVPFAPKALKVKWSDQSTAHAGDALQRDTVHFTGHGAVWSVSARRRPTVPQFRCVRVSLAYFLRISAQARVLCLLRGLNNVSLNFGSPTPQLKIWAHE